LAWTVGGCLLIFALLEYWRPCYFLTDDNLSGGFPLLTEMGREMRAGRAPFRSDYLFGGNYNFLRDLDAVQWHPFTMLPALLADTFARFWIIDISALLFLLLTTVGFTLLAYRLREELSLRIPDVYLVFYTLSFVFSTYVLTVGASWVTFLGNQSALPWLALGILDRKVTRGTMLVLLFTLHEILVAYPPLTVSGGLCLTLFAMGVALWRRSFQPLFCWCAGNLLAPLVLAPLFVSVMDGFGHSVRILGLPLDQLSVFNIPATLFPFSFLMGNWTEPLALWHGDKTLSTLNFPYLPSILACAAAWCVVPALFVRSPWRPLDKVCLVLCGVLVVFIMRPDWLAVTMVHLPFFRSMRWPFREVILFLFFLHLFFVLRFPERPPRGMAALAFFSLFMFLAPLPFIRVPTLNALGLDRRLLLSGQAERFWTGVKTQLKPTDEIVTVINWPYWEAHSKEIPYTLLGTANFPEYFQVRCISGYSPTAPSDQMPLKTYPGLWFGAYRDDQLPQVLAERPNLKVLRIERTQPLKITMSTGSGPEMDLTPYLQSAGITSPAADPAPSSGR
jgi:hypothetical protein